MNEGKSMYTLAETLFPIYRSITGEGVRETFRILKEWLGDACTFNLYEVPTGTAVFDWTVPKEWVIRDAYIEKKPGEKILSFQDCPLCVVGYSKPVDEWVTLEELKEIVHTQPDQPDLIPYVTSYYKERYGFCMTENQKQNLKPGRYHIVIDSELKDGSLTYADVILPGESEEEILISTYSCHPTMANDNCSGIVLAAQMIKYVASLENRKYTYRFVFGPETIGILTYLSQNERWKMLREKVKAGFVLSCVGDDRGYAIVHSQSEKTLSDRVLMNVLKDGEPEKVKEYSFLERGSDERQYNYPGFGLGVVGFCRSKYWEFPEYHTSADDLTVISEEGLQGSFNIMKEAVDALEHNEIYTANTLGEPQMGRRGLYPTLSQKGVWDGVRVMMDVLLYADGKRDLLEISEAIHVPVRELIPVIQTLENADLIRKWITGVRSV